MDRSERSILKQEKGITWLCGLRFLTPPPLSLLPPLLPLLLHFRSHSASYNWPSLPRILPYIRLRLLRQSPARQGGLIRSLGVLTSLGRTNRFNSLLSRCSPRTACTTNHPSPTRWFRNCRFYPSLSFFLFLILFVAFAYPCIVQFFISSPSMLLCNFSRLNLISCQLWPLLVSEFHASFLQIYQFCARCKNYLLVSQAYYMWCFSYYKDKKNVYLLFLS